jgi:hypothetical protein
MRHDDAPPPADESDYGRTESSLKTPMVAKRFALVAFNQIQMLGGASYFVKGLIPRVGLVIVWGPPKRRTARLARKSSADSFPSKSE